MKKSILTFFLIVFIATILSTLVTAATLKGVVYNTNLNVEKNVLILVSSVPEQKFLSKDGSYSFNLPLGKYTLTAIKGDLKINEEVNIVNEGEFVFDLFLLPDFTEEDQLWAETGENYFEENNKSFLAKYWTYMVTFIIIIILFLRFLKVRLKYGPLRRFGKKVRADQNKTIEQHKKEIAQEPGYSERVLDIIKKHDGRIKQKTLRHEMLDLSEAKVSLIITELEHRNKVEKIKKGRGNVIILKEK